MILKKYIVNLKNECDNIIEVEYNLVKTFIGKKEIYGFIINTKNHTTKDSYEEKYTDFTDNLQKAESIFLKLIENKVLSSNLINVLDDMTN